jgi:hypothetical protein
MWVLIQQSSWDFRSLGLMANWLAHVGHTHNVGGGEIRPTCSTLPCAVPIDWDVNSPACGVNRRNQQTAACGPQRVDSYMASEHPCFETRHRQFWFSFSTISQFLNDFSVSQRFLGFSTISQFLNDFSVSQRFLCLSTISQSLNDFSLSQRFLSLSTISQSRNDFSISQRFLSLSTISQSLNDFSFSQRFLSFSTISQFLNDFSVSQRFLKVWTV